MPFRPFLLLIAQRLFELLVADAAACITGICLLHKLLEFTPEDRITPADALKHPFFELELEPEENALFNPLPTSPRVDQSRSANSNQGASKQGTAPQSIPALAPAIAQPVQQQPEPEREA